jgi:hypothetical protein
MILSGCMNCVFQWVNTPPYLGGSGIFPEIGHLDSLFLNIFRHKLGWHVKKISAASFPLLVIHGIIYPSSHLILNDLCN